MILLNQHSLKVPFKAFEGGSCAIFDAPFRKISTNYELNSDCTVADRGVRVLLTPG